MRRPLLFLFALGLSVAGAWWVAALGSPEEIDADAPRPAPHAWIQRTFPHFNARTDAYHMAFVEAQSLRAAAKTNPFGTWQLVGPTNIGGRISDIVYDHHNPSTIYVAAATGGLFKSVDSGRSWRPIFDDQPVLSIGDIAIDPLNPTVLYVGTGEANGLDNNYTGSGLYKSTDSGQTWTFLGLEKTVSIARIVIDPTDTRRIFVATMGSYYTPNPERGLYRSEDGGLTWERILYLDDVTGVIDVVVRPDNPQVLFAATWHRTRSIEKTELSGTSSGIYRSNDGGTTWEKLGATQGLPTTAASRIGLALSRSTPDVMYALYTVTGRTSIETSLMGLYISRNGGQTWRDADIDKEVANGFSNFSWYFGQIRVNPYKPEQVFVMDQKFMQSTNFGETWTHQTGTHLDHHALEFHPQNPTILLNGNDGGLARSVDGGKTWERLTDLPITQFYEIALDPTNPRRLYGGTQDNGTIRSTSGALDDWEAIMAGDGFYTIVDPTNPHIIYTAIQQGRLVKIIAGEIISATKGIVASEPRNWSTPVVMDPYNPQVLYYGTNRLYRTEDGAQSWYPISGDLTKQLGLEYLGTLTAIAIAKTNTAILYAGTDDGNIWVSEDYGQNWRNVTHAPLPNRWITRIAIDPIDDKVAYVTFSGLRWQEAQPHIFRTADRGHTWTDISGTAPFRLPDTPINALAIDPRNTHVLYVGTDIGAFVSIDRGISWGPLGDGLPTVAVTDMKFFDDGTAENRFLVAGTHGRSMYKLDLSRIFTATETEAPIPTLSTLDPAYPNPFTDQTTFTWHLSQPTPTRLEVFDLLGRRVAVLFDGMAATGTHSTSWQDATQAAGTYLVRLTVNHDSSQRTNTILIQRVR